ncbi:methionyl-tRNA formyltransferase [Candidatus Marinamargulisbacteria bacterium SCGC AG-343-K17]|nr:methionyl-tRNA formyltransferase [Candidatus Marinamargulisbacteria bacterium SCGC AG-343-K17]
MSCHILFIGTPEFSVPTLESLISEFNDGEISVISMPDKVRGRGQSTSPSSVKSLAQTHQLPVYTPLTKSDLTQKIHDLSPDLIIVVAYGMIIEKQITDHYFCVNIHSSLLPQYRGASPIHTALLNGDDTTGITLIKMNEAMDEGDILVQVELSIDPLDNLGTLTDKLSQLGAQTMIEFIHNCFLPKNITLTPQNNNMASYTKKIDKADLLLDTNENSKLLHNKIRAYSPKPGAYVIHNNKRIKIIASELINDQLQLVKVQPEGKPIMNYHDFLQGSPEGIQL